MKRASRKYLAFRDPLRLAGDNFFACVGRIYPLAKARSEKLILWRAADFFPVLLSIARSVRSYVSVMRFSAYLCALLKEFRTYVNSGHPVTRDTDPRLIIFWVQNFTSLPSFSSKFQWKAEKNEAKLRRAVLDVAARWCFKRTQVDLHSG